MKRSTRQGMIMALLLPSLWGIPRFDVDYGSVSVQAPHAHIQAYSAAQPPGQEVTYTRPAPLFEEFYRRQDGIRVLGHPRSWLLTDDDVYSQYFEKGRIEWHPEVPRTSPWRFAYARLAADLIERGARLPVGGDTSTATYATLKNATLPEVRHAPPRPGIDGPIDAGERGVFVPYDAYLRSAPGHFIARPFWAYINQAELFPGGWLHDIGLPLSEPLPVLVSKRGQERQITLQVFERTILTNDPRNPVGYQIERANVGTDYLTAFPWGAEDAAILAAVPFDPSAEPFILRTIQMVDDDVARVYLLPDNSGTVKIDPAWVFVQRQGNGAWRKIAGPSTVFDEAAYDQLGIPTMMRLGHNLERSLYDSARQRFPNIAGFRLDRMVGGFAKLTTLDPDGSSRETIFARLDTINSWTILGNIPTTEQIKVGVPEVLRTYAG